MAARTLTDLFGASADLTTGTLTIELSDFTDVGLDGGSPDPSDIAAALILKWQDTQATDADDDPANGVVVDDPFRSFLTRGNQPQIQYSYGVSFYTPDNTTGLDPDDVT